jgi:hypothetical protein
VLRRNYVAKALREPLLHFLLIGAAVFAVSSSVEDEAVSVGNDRILVTAADAARLAVLWQKRWQRPPAAEELQGLIEDHVREEILYREALALGLDRDDTIIRRHLRRKFEFLMEDLAATREPEAAEIAAFFEVNQASYRTPARVSFTQLYFKSERRGTSGASQASLVLADLRSGAHIADIQELGDGTLLDRRYRERTETELVAIFGTDFADALSRLDIGSWAGPIASDYGLHLVQLDARLGGEIPPLSAVERQVRNDWAYEQRQRANAALYEALRARYEVIVQDASLTGSQ